MISKDVLISQLNDLFAPDSIAIVGLPREMKTGKLFLLSLLDQEYKGKIYPVNPNTKEIDGFKSYPSLLDIPGKVDLVIILVPNNATLPVLKECAIKGVKGAVLFTAGYKETGSEEGKALEKQFLSIARKSGMRLIGPNGMGLFAPKSGISFFPQLPRRSGPVSLISHSGSLANIVCRMSPEKGIYFGKAVSLGNECDLNSADFLTYYAEDDETKVIGAYIEGICNSRYFLSALKETASRKPVIIWKVGLTSEGSKAASSHTGALASTPEIWDGVIQQTGAIPAVGFENWVDLLMGFTHFPPGLGERTAIISGPGGLAVSAAEACGHAGLKLAELSPETIDNLSKFVPLTGTSLKNPIDVGMSASLDIDIYIQSARIAAEDPNIDAVFMIGIGFSNEDNTRLAEALIQTRRELNKPIAMINVPGFDRNLAQLLCESSVPFFESAERAMSTYSAVRNYQQWKDRVE